MYPSATRPESGVFVHDQVEALRAIGDLEVVLFTFRPHGPASYARAARSLHRRFRGERFDVVHAHQGLAGWTALAAPRAAHLLTFHGTDLIHPLAGPLSRLLARVVDLPATVSAELARSDPGGLPGAGRRRRVAVLPCGVNLARFRPSDRLAARRRLELDPDGRYLLFPADPARREKRYELARELADAAGDTTILSYRHTAPADAATYVNAANAVVVTSQREGFGLAVLEALGCNVPVLATPEGIAPLALAGIDGTLCAPFSLETWLPAVTTHLEDSDPRIDGRARAGLFESNRMAKRVQLAYRALAADVDESGLR